MGNAAGDFRQVQRGVSIHPGCLRVPRERQVRTVFHPRGRRPRSGVDWAMLDEPAIRSRHRRLDAEGVRVVAGDSGRCDVFGASQNGYSMVARLGDEGRD